VYSTDEKTTKRRVDMAHIYTISFPSQVDDESEYLLLYLKEKNLIKRVFNRQAESVMVVVSNKQRFLAYANRKKRESGDPGYIIKSWDYVGETGPAAPSSKEGRIAAARKRNARRKRGWKFKS